jgi:hypothetical protein
MATASRCLQLFIAASARATPSCTPLTYLELAARPTSQRAQDAAGETATAWHRIERAYRPARRHRFRACMPDGAKRLTAPYRSGLSRDWIEVKNANSQAEW